MCYHMRVYVVVPFRVYECVIICVYMWSSHLGCMNVLSYACICGRVSIGYRSSESLL